MSPRRSSTQSKKGSQPAGTSRPQPGAPATPPAGAQTNQRNGGQPAPAIAPVSDESPAQVRGAASIVEIETTPQPPVVEAVPVQPHGDVETPRVAPLDAEETAGHALQAQSPGETLHMTPTLLENVADTWAVAQRDPDDAALPPAADAPRPAPNERRPASVRSRIPAWPFFAAGVMMLGLAGIGFAVHGGLFAATSHHQAASKPTPPPPTRQWFFSPLATPPDQVFLELYNPNRRAVDLSIELLGPGPTPDRHVRLARRSGGEVELPTATSNAPVIVRASEPILTRRVVIRQGHVYPSYGAPAAQVQVGQGK